MKILILPLLFVLTLQSSVTQTSGNDSSFLRKNFATPPLSARPKALWPWVNGNFSLSRITYEMEEAKRKGMGGFDIWDVGSQINPDNVMPAGPAFLSDESLDGIAHAIREGNRLGLELGLITSSSWNAGGAWIEPQHGAMALFKSDTVITGPSQFKGNLVFPDIPENYNGHKTLVKRDAQGLPVFYKDVAVILHPLRADSLVRQNEISILDARNGSVTVSIPKGKWRLIRYVCVPTGQPLMIPSKNSNGLMLDHFSAAAQEANMKYIIQRLKTKFPDFKDQSLKYLYEDSYEVNTAVWTPLLPSFFKTKTGYEIEKYLPALDGFKIESNDVTQRFIFDFNKVLSDLIIENHYAKGKEICAREGLGFHAEAGGPGKPIHNVPFEDLKALGSLTVPRGEFWNKHPQLEALQIVKGISSAAHIYNQTFVEAEAFTSVWLWQEGPDELKPLADRAMCEGLNRFVYHTFPHTTPEAGNPGWIYNFGTLINTTNGWWPMSQGFHEYLARCSFLLQQGNFKGDVAFYYGDEAPNFVPPKQIPPTLGKGYDYDVVNTDIILNYMEVKDGKISLPHGQFYEVLVLPEGERINPEVLRKIEAMIKAGATVVGKRPSRAYSLANFAEADKQVREIGRRVWGNMVGKEKKYGAGKIVWGKSVRQVLQEKQVGPDVEFKSTTTHDSCDYIHRVTDAEEIYFIRNVSKGRYSGDATFRIKGKQPFWYNPVNGRILPVVNFKETQTGTTIPLTLLGEESGFIIFERTYKQTKQELQAQVTNTSTGPAVSSMKDEKKIDIDKQWTIEFEHTASMTGSIEKSTLQSWHMSPDESIRHYSGTGLYKNEFIMPKEQLRSDTRILLSLNKVEEIAEVYINGECIGTHWFMSHQFDITPIVREGTNLISIEVVNTINNALIGDAKKPEQYRTYKSNISKLPNAWSTPFADAPLLPAGLLGPVSLLFVKTP